MGEQHFLSAVHAVQLPSLLKGPVYSLTHKALHGPSYPDYVLPVLELRPDEEAEEEDEGDQHHHEDGRVILNHGTLLSMELTVINFF